MSRSTRRWRPEGARSRSWVSYYTGTGATRLCRDHEVQQQEHGQHPRDDHGLFMAQPQQEGARPAGVPG
eukprot:8584568-Heterocapsa_arctica.AAC.1